MKKIINLNFTRFPPDIPNLCLPSECRESGTFCGLNTRKADLNFGKCNTQVWLWWCGGGGVVVVVWYFPIIIPTQFELYCIELN